MSKRIILTKGLPGSGKSTWAKALVEKHPGQYKRVNKDDLRAMLDCSRWSKQNESFVLKLRDNIVTSALKDGLSVIVDDTNFHAKHETRMRDIAKEYAATVEIQDFTDVPLETCIERDLKRHNSVGEKLIRKMYNEYLKPQPVKEQPDPSLPYCVICDLDGTMCLMNGRSPYDASTCDRDLPNEPVVWHVQQLLDQGEKVIFVSGRHDTFRPQTETWLNAHLNGSYEALLMRPGGDMRQDAIIKQEIYAQHIKGKYNVRYVLDDRQRVVDAWRAMGLTVFQVAEGEF